VIVDSSALLAILQEEPEAERLLRAIAVARPRLLSTANFLETSIVIESRYGSEGGRDLDLLIAKLEIDVVAFTRKQADIARRAYRAFGKGVDWAGLNFGDCFAYALATDTGAPLLFKGDDFTRSDVTAAVY
jgi:ribonuclease VapC